MKYWSHSVTFSTVIHLGPLQRITFRCTIVILFSCLKIWSSLDLPRTTHNYFCFDTFSNVKQEQSVTKKITFYMDCLSCETFCRKHPENYGYQCMEIVQCRRERETCNRAFLCFANSSQIYVIENDIYLFLFKFKLHNDNDIFFGSRPTWHVASGICIYAKAVLFANYSKVSSTSLISCYILRNMKLYLFNIKRIGG